MEYYLFTFRIDIDFEYYELGLHLEVTYDSMQVFFGPEIIMIRTSYYHCNANDFGHEYMIIHTIIF